VSEIDYQMLKLERSCKHKIDTFYHQSNSMKLLTTPKWIRRRNRTESSF